MIATIKMNNGGEIHSCNITDVTDYAITIIYRFGLAKTSLLKEDIKGIKIEEYYHQEILDKIEQYGYELLPVFDEDKMEEEIADTINEVRKELEDKFGIRIEIYDWSWEWRE